MASPPRAWTSAVLILIAASVAGLGLGSLMPYGPGLRDDSYTYIHAGEMVAETGTYSRATASGELRPVTNFPPMYSLALGLGYRVGLPRLVAPKLLDQLLLAILILVTGAALGLVSRSPWAVAFGVLWILSSSALTGLFTWAQSEPLFLVLVEAGTILAVMYSLRRDSPPLLALSAALLGLAVLTRYAGVGVVLGVLIVLGTNRAIDLGRRLREALLFASISILPLVLFLVRNLVVAGDVANRPTPAWHPPTFDLWTSGARTALAWFLPDRVVAAVSPAAAVAAVAVGVVLVGILLVRLRSTAGPSFSANPSLREMARILMGASLGYLSGIVVTIFLLDRLLPLDDRILGPLLFFLVQLAALGIALVTFRKRWRVLLGVLLTVFLAFQAVRQVALVRALEKDGQGYSAREWRESDVAGFVCGLPTVPVYTNDVPALYFACDRHAFPLPSKTNPASLEPNPDYPAQVGALQSALQEGGVVAILGWYGEERLARLGVDELAAGLTARAVFDDGIVYAR